MFKRHSLQVKVVKDNNTDTAVDEETRFHLRATMINKIAKEQTKNVAYAIVGVAAVLTALSTASEIAVNAAPKKH